MNKRIRDIIFVAFDVETTGLTPSLDRIVEIGAVKFYKRNIIDTFQELINPKMQIPPEATLVNGITDTMVRESPSIEKILPQFLTFLGDAVQVAHNASFDIGFLNHDLTMLKLETQDTPILDTCSIARRLFPGLYSYSLESLAIYLGIKSEKYHRALEDSIVCMEIFLKCCTKIGDLDYITLEDILVVNESGLNSDISEILLEDKFQPLRSALKSGNRIEIDYEDATGVITKREIKPILVGYFKGSPMIEAFCYKRKAKRHFRLDRIIKFR